MLGRRGYRCEPNLGLWSLLAAARRAGWAESEILDLNLEALKEYKQGNRRPDAWVEVLRRKLDQFQPDVAGVSCLFSTTAGLALEIARAIRKHGKAKVVMGGTEATVDPELLLRETAVDYCVSGEGEDAFCGLLADLASGASPVGRPGVGSLVSGKPVVTARAKYSAGLDALPMLDPELIPFAEYAATGRVAGLFNVRDLALPYETSRGCPFRCTFCGAHVVWGRKVRYKSLERIAGELDFMRSRLDFRHVYLQDDTPFLDKARTLAVLEVFKARRIDLHFPNSLRVNSLDEGILDALSAAGVKRINLAIESCLEETLKQRMKKDVDLAHAARIIDYARDHTALEVTANILLGYPGETAQDVAESLERLKGMRLDWISFGFVEPWHGSEVHALALAKGYIKEDAANPSLDVCRVNTEHLTHRQLEEAVDRANIEFNFRNNVNIAEKRFDRARGFFEYVLATVPEHEEARKALARCS
ncbi:MAG: radical SAM protein [Elusimicrobiota bacterium]